MPLAKVRGIAQEEMFKVVKSVCAFSHYDLESSLAGFSYETPSSFTEFQEQGDTWDEFMKRFYVQWSEHNWKRKALDKFNKIQQTGSFEDYQREGEKTYHYIKHFVPEYTAIQ